MIPNAADRDRSDDPDGDGFKNLEEYLFGTSPVSGNGSLLQTSPSGGQLVIRWNQRTGGSYLLQESSTLVAPWAGSAIVPIDDPNQSGVPADYLRRQATIPTSEARKFFRVLGAE